MKGFSPHLPQVPARAALKSAKPFSRPHLIAGLTQAGYEVGALCFFLAMTKHNVLLAGSRKPLGSWPYSYPGGYRSWS